MLIFDILGRPIPQKQTQFFRGHAYDPSAKAKTMLQWQMQAHAPKEPFPGPISVDMWFYFQVPKSTSKVKRRQMLNGTIQHIIRPDVDNLGYLITNAMKKLIYIDDSQVVDLYLHKRYAEEYKTTVKIIPYSYMFDTFNPNLGGEDESCL